jgi:hypothetical protein
MMRVTLDAARRRAVSPCSPVTPPGPSAPTATTSRSAPTRSRCSAPTPSVSGLSSPVWSGGAAPEPPPVSGPARQEVAAAAARTRGDIVAAVPEMADAPLAARRHMLGRIGKDTGGALLTPAQAPVCVGNAPPPTVGRWGSVGGGFRGACDSWHPRPMMDGVLEAAWQELLREVDGQEPRAGVDGLVAGHDWRAGEGGAATSTMTLMPRLAATVPPQQRTPRAFLPPR